jgi:hypothetical protein
MQLPIDSTYGVSPIGEVNPKKLEHEIKNIAVANCSFQQLDGVVLTNVLFINSEIWYGAAQSYCRTSSLCAASLFSQRTRRDRTFYSMLR